MPRRAKKEIAQAAEEIRTELPTEVAAEVKPRRTSAEILAHARQVKAEKRKQRLAEEARQAAASQPAEKNGDAAAKPKRRRRTKAEMAADTVTAAAEDAPKAKSKNGKPKMTREESIAYARQVRMQKRQQRLAETAQMAENQTAEKAEKTTAKPKRRRTKAEIIAVAAVKATESAAQSEQKAAVPAAVKEEKAPAAKPVDAKKKAPWNTYNIRDRARLNRLAKGYIDFISECKTERESAEYAVAAAKKAGYIDLAEAIKSGKKLTAGDKVYAVCMKKTVALFNIGTEPIEDGLSILGAHIDTCRLDLKQNPVYEDGGFCYLDTHYYGGIKKYQWVALPLALHGVVAKKDGSVINIVIGEDESDPAFCVTDLLIHLSQEQMEKKGSVVVEGENLDIICGNLPLDGEEKDAVKKAVLQLLKEKYAIEEDDFLSAELTFVPAGRAREMGFDRSLILGYGQDDRVCAYTSLVAMLEVEKVERTSCCLLVDKEEIGSVGATGMQSRFFENVLAEILALLGKSGDLALRRVLANSRMLSSDVSSAYDALYASAYDKKNVAYLGKGVVFNKFTGSRGKSGSNDANAEYLAKIRAIMDKNKVHFQLSELGKVDLGGGGTIAYIMALYGMDVIDSGVGVLSMHAPWEVTSKVDLYEAKKAYAAFIAEK